MGVAVKSCSSLFSQHSFSLSLYIPSPASESPLTSPHPHCSHPHLPPPSLLPPSPPTLTSSHPHCSHPHLPPPSLLPPSLLPPSPPPILTSSHPHCSHPHLLPPSPPPTLTAPLSTHLSCIFLPSSLPPFFLPHLVLSPLALSLPSLLPSLTTHPSLSSLPSSLPPSLLSSLPPPPHFQPSSHHVCRWAVQDLVHRRLLSPEHTQKVPREVGVGLCLLQRLAVYLHR